MACVFSSLIRLIQDFFSFKTRTKHFHGPQKHGPCEDEATSFPGPLSFSTREEKERGPGNEVEDNLVPRVLRLLGQRFGRRERLWGNGIILIFLIGYSGNNEIGEAEVGSM